MPILEVEHIQKSFDDIEVLKDISFTLQSSVLREAVKQLFFVVLISLRNLIAVLLKLMTKFYMML